MKHSLDNGGEVVGTNVVVAMENLVDMDYILTMVADIDNHNKQNFQQSF